MYILSEHVSQLRYLQGQSCLHSTATQKVFYHEAFGGRSKLHVVHESDVNLNERRATEYKKNDLCPSFHYCTLGKMEQNVARVNLMSNLAVSQLWLRLRRSLLSKANRNSFRRNNCPSVFNTWVCLFLEQRLNPRIRGRASRVFIHQNSDVPVWCTSGSFHTIGGDLINEVGNTDSSAVIFSITDASLRSLPLRFCINHTRLSIAAIQVSSCRNPE